MTALSYAPETGMPQGAFAIATLEHRGRIFPALVKPRGDICDLSGDFQDTHAIFDDWDRAFDTLYARAQTSSPSALHIDEARKLSPLAHPNLLCAGANYRQHVIEMLTHGSFNAHNRQLNEGDDDFWKRNAEIVDRRAREGIPYFWTGLHSSLAGAEDDLVLPVAGRNHDWELELGVVLARGARHVAVEQAHTLIAGYVMVNDIGTLDQFRRTDIPWGFDWVSKHQPGFKPCGPFIVPAQFIKPDDQMRIKLCVNGVTKQDWPVSDMIFSIEKILSYASERVRLMAGDLLLTGSPPGNGSLTGQFLQQGDVMEGSITGLGRQRTLCRAETGRVRWPFPQS